MLCFLNEIVCVIRVISVIKYAGENILTSKMIYVDIVLLSDKLSLSEVTIRPRDL